MKKLWDNIILKLKKIFLKKKNIVISIVCLIILLAIILILVFGNFNKNKFALNTIYELYPEEVRKIYSNLVDVSCYGDMHFDIKLDSGEKRISDINKTDLMNYLFSYMEKEDLLTSDIEVSTIKKITKELFSENIDLVNDIKDYSYDNYLYNIKNGKIIRKKNTCISDIKYITYLYGYSYNENELSIDVNVAYLKDGILYDFSDNKLGEYDGDVSKLNRLTKNTTYYRLNYTKKNGIYKLVSIEWKSRT